MSDFRIEDHPVVFLKPRLSYPYAWVGHVPFAYLLIDLLRPRMLVELGTDSGNSYLAFCQAVVELNSPTRCTAVDSWQGDPHARRYGEGVYETLKAYHDPRYASFSRLHRSYFIDALAEFEDGSVDLLHIDGLHTYDAVSEDFNTWLPKLSDRAVVIFHDSQVHDRGFGVSRFLDELRGRYRITEFEHSNGLGIALVGSNIPSAFASFIDAFEARPEQMRRFFRELGDSLIASGGRPGGARAEQVTPDVTCRVYYRSEQQNFDDSRVVMAELTDPHGPLALEFSFPDGVRPAFIRIDPADHAGAFRFSGMTFSVGGTASVVTDASDRVGFVTGDLLPGQSPSDLRLVSFGEDPHLELAVGDIVGRLPADGRLSLSATVDFEVVLNEPAFWPLARAQDEALKALKAIVHQERAEIAGSVVDRGPTVSGASLADISTTLGAMHLAGILILPERGPSLYARKLDEAFTAERRVRGQVIGLDDVALVRFDARSLGSSPFVRLDIPAIPGCYVLSGVTIDGTSIVDIRRRVIAVRGRLIESAPRGSVAIASEESAPYLELDISDLDLHDSLTVSIVRDLRKPWVSESQERIFENTERHLRETDQSLAALRAAAAETDDASDVRFERIVNGLKVLEEGSAALRADNASLRAELAALTQFEINRGIIRRIWRRLKRMI